MTNNEIINKKDYKYDFSESNDKKNENWRKNEKDLKYLGLCLYEQNINEYDVQEINRLVNQYIENKVIDIVLLVKKMIIFYIKKFEL